MMNDPTPSPPPADAPRSADWKSSVFVALGALALHVAVIWWVAVPGSFRKYALAAELWISGQLPGERLVDFSPLYFQLSLWLERFVPWPESAMVGLQIVLGAASVGLLHALLIRRVAARWAVGISGLFTIDRHLLVYERILEPEVPLLFLLLLVLVLLDRRAESAALPPILTAGVAAALALAARPTFLPAFALVPLYFGWRGLRGRSWWRASLAFSIPVLVAVVLLGGRAAAISGDPGTPVMNPGTVFFEGNNPLSHGTSAIYPPMVLGVMRHTQDTPDSAHQHYRDVARGSTGEALGIAEVNAFWSGRAMAFLRDEPAHALARLREKLIRAIHAYRWHDVPTAWRYDDRLPIPSVPFALLAPLALLGAALEAHRWRSSLLIYALAGLQLAVMLVFYVSARQRLVLLPAVLYFVAVALETLARQRRRALVWGVLCALFALVLMLPDDAMRDEAYRRQGFAAAEMKLDEIRSLSQSAPLAHHADRVVEAVATAPWWLDWLYPAFFPRQGSTLEQRVADALERRRQAADFPTFQLDLLDFDRAAVLLRAGRLDQAEPLLEDLASRGVSVYRGGQQPSHPEILLARLHIAKGEPQEAEEWLRRVLQEAPGDPFALAELVALTDDVEAAAQLDRYWSELDVHYLLGRTLLRHGRAEAAVEHLAFVVERFAALRDARVALAAALGRIGRLDEAVDHYLAASRIRPEPIVEPEAIVSLFRRWGRQHADDPAAQLTTAQVLHQHGLFDEALAMLEDLETPPRLAEAVAREIERLERVVSY